MSEAAENSPSRRRRQREAVIDDELVATVLREDDPDGPAWQALSAALMEYGRPRLLAWVRSGQIAHIARNAGVRGARRLPSTIRYRDDAEGLVHEVLLDALRTFRERSLPRWRPEQGLKVTTYWINWCLMVLPDAYGRWYRREMRPRLRAVPTDVITEVMDGDAGAEVVACARRMLVDRCRDDPLAQRIVLARVAGFTWNEIAVELTTEGTPTTAREARQRVRNLLRPEFESRESAE